MSLSLAMNSALNGIKTSQNAIDLTSSNISNVNTEGYTRKVYKQSTLVLYDGRSSGAISASSRPMPEPLSATETSLRPPAVTSTSMRNAPASSEFSRSSLTTDAGRSTTSPAAILFATSWDSIRIFDPFFGSMASG